MSEERRCEKQVWRGYGMGDGPAEAGHSQCRRSGKVKEDGKWWCSTHAPSAEAARLAKRAERALPPTFLNTDKRIWNDAIEAAAGYHDSEAKGLRRLVRLGNKLVTKARRAEVVKFAEEHEAHAAAIRRLKKE